MSAKTLMTAEEFERLPDTEDVAYELDEGELIERPSRSMIHNFIRGKTEGLIGNHLREHPEQGIVVAEEKFRLADGTIRQPDLALVGKDQIPSIAWEPNIQPFAPKLAIEIGSPTNTLRDLERKIRQYLDGGVLTVWIFMTNLKQINIQSAREKPRILTADDLLDHPQLLPGFSLRVGELFEIPK
jgi:Uma2 family endonuclease